MRFPAAVTWVTASRTCLGVSAGVVSMLALTPADALASGAIVADGRGLAYFALVILFAGYALTCHLLMLASFFRFPAVSILHLVVALSCPFLLWSAWEQSRSEISLSANLWNVWGAAGVVLAPLLLAPPLMQWFGHRGGTGTPRAAWVLVASTYVAGVGLLVWGMAH